jgi:hypothetical protein
MRIYFIGNLPAEQGDDRMKHEVKRNRLTIYNTSYNYTYNHIER